MNGKMKIWFIIGASLILIGCIMFGGVMMKLDWNFKKLSTVKYETNTYEIADEFKEIQVETDTADIVFMPSDNETAKVICYEETNEKHSVWTKDSVLNIKLVDKKKWYHNIGINFASAKITVYLPVKEYGELSVKADTGDIDIPEEFSFKDINVKVSTGDIKNYASAEKNVKLTASTGKVFVKKTSCTSLDIKTSTGKITVDSVDCKEDVELKVSTGKTNLTDLKCNDLTSKGTTGDLIMENVVAEGIFNIVRDTGDVKFESCDASEINVETTTGNVKGSLLSDKVYIVNTDTGRIEVPKTVTGGKCEIVTDTGDIKITVK